jgi:hypothetical protein
MKQISPFLPIKDREGVYITQQPRHSVFSKKKPRHSVPWVTITWEPNFPKVYILVALCNADNSITHGPHGWYPAQCSYRESRGECGVRSNKIIVALTRVLYRYNHDICFSLFPHDENTWVPAMSYHSHLGY